MERLTEWKDDKKMLAKPKFSGDFGSSNILCRLAEYEDREETLKNNLIQALTENSYEEENIRVVDLDTALSIIREIL